MSKYVAKSFSVHVYVDVNVIAPSYPVLPGIFILFSYVHFDFCFLLLSSRVFMNILVVLAPC